MLDASRQPLRADPPATPCRDRKGLKMDDFSLLDIFFTVLWDPAQRDRLLVG
jgi:hypothetical protein